MRYRRKPATVEAVRWDGDNVEEIKTFLGGAEPTVYRQGGLEGKALLSVPTADAGGRIVDPGDYVVRREDGAIDVSAAEIFERAYEPTGD